MMMLLIFTHTKGLDVTGKVVKKPLLLVLCISLLRTLFILRSCDALALKAV